jgi:hypothetical protein
MKRIIITVMLVLVLTAASGGSALAEGPSDAAYNAPAKGHQGVPGKGLGHEMGQGKGHLIHGQGAGGQGPGGQGPPGGQGAGNETDVEEEGQVE